MNGVQGLLRAPGVRGRRINVRQNILYFGFGVLFIVFAATLGDQGFTSSNNLLNIIRQTATISVTPRARARATQSSH